MLHLLTLSASDATYLLGAQGESCAATCGIQGLECLNTGVGQISGTDIFTKVGIKCNGTAQA